MAAATADSPATRQHEEPEPERATSRGPTEYVVLESPTKELKPGAELRFVAQVSADSKKDARWEAVDKDAALKKRVVYDEKENPEPKPAFLIAVAVRHAHTEETVEEAEVTRTRR